MNRVRNTMQGVAMVEFAIVVWLLLFLALGFVELGRALYQHNTLHEAVAVGPRYLARVPGIVDMSSGCSWDDETSAWTDATNLVIYGELNNSGTPVLNGLTIDTISLRHYDDGTIDACVIRVDASMSFNSLFGDLFPIPVTLNAAAEERYIGG